MSTDCANPLYLQWIREWWDTATTNNAKDRLTYKGAWESMKANPIAFTHPSEAIKLRGIGPKLVNRLTKRLQQHCADNGIEMPEEPSKKRPLAENTQNEGNQNGSEEISASKRAKKAPKAYVPKPRSGAYALLLALAELPEGQTVGLTKTELQIRAQPHADTSFTVPPDPSKFHTAWNSMSTLETKHLVYTFGRPVKKYALTDEGWAIVNCMKQTNTAGDIVSRRHQSIFPVPAVPLVAGYVHLAQNRVIVDIDDDDEDSLTLVDDLEDRIVRKFGSRENFQKLITDRAFGLDKTADAESLELMKEFAERATSGIADAPNSNVALRAASRAGKITTKQLSADTPDGVMKRNSGNHVRPTSSTSIPRRSTISTHLNAEDIPSYEPIVIKPGSFTVELVLDSREVRSKTDRNYIQDQFNKAGLRCEQRALQVGDMVWTARIHDPAIINQLELGDRKIPEIILDYVVERKRLDDLDSSIRDNRFLEQKFRLKRSGIRNAIYIIEDYGSMNAMEEQQHTRMVTAVVATQIIDGFFVKRTKKLDDTIAYLASITKVLKNQYERKPLLVIPSSILTPQNHFLLRAPPGERRYVTYEALAGLASKSAILTSRDIFLKMLMCTRGITGDKAIEIQKHWQVPRRLIEAYELLPQVDQKHDLVWSKAGSYQDKRKIGKAVSQTLAEIWGRS